MGLLYRAGNFYGGLNLSSGEYVANNEATYLNNVVPFKEEGMGGLSKMKGKRLLVTADEGVKGIYEAIFTSGSSLTLVVGLTKIWKLNSDNTLTELTGAGTRFTTDSTLIDFEIHNDLVIIPKVGNAPKTVSSTGAVANLVWPPAGVTGYPRWIEEFGNRVWMSGNSGYYDEIYYSDYNDSTTWNALKAGGAGWFSVPSGQAIKYLKTYGNSLMTIFTENELYYLQGETPPEDIASGLRPFYLDKYYKGLRFNSPFAIVNTGQGQFFWNRKNIVNLSNTDKFGNVENGIVSYKINGRLDNINSSYLDNIVGAYVHTKNQIWWFVPISSATANNQLLILDLDTNGFYIGENRTADCICVKKDGTILTGNSDGTIYQEDYAYTYGSSGYSSEWRTGWLDFEGQRMSISELILVYSQQSNDSFDVDIYIDYNSEVHKTITLTPSTSLTSLYDDEAIYDSEYYYASSSASRLKEQGITYCYAIKIGIRHASSTNNFRFLDLQLYGGKA